jgi:outer membrane lipoprotein-sorting protein
VVASLLLGFGLWACGDETKPTTSTTATPTASTGAPEPTALPGLPDDDTDLPLDTPPTTSGEAPPPVAPSAAPSAATSAAPTLAPSAAPKTAPPAPLPVPDPPATAQVPAPPPSAEPPPPAAEAGSADEVAGRIDAVYAPVQRFRARFDQKYTAKVHGTSKNSKGVIYVLKPGKLSLSYQKPNQNRAVSDGATLKVYEHENKQMFVKDVKNTEYPGAFAFILGKGLRSSFTFAFHKTSKFEGGPVIVGTPRVPNPGYSKVLFYVDEGLLKSGDLGCIRRVLVIDAQGNKNRFDFIHAEQPEKIAPDEFVFEPPKGTEIISG